jgi:hypothetical protein
MNTDLYWQLFSSTGSLQAYLLYRQTAEQASEDPG